MAKKIAILGCGSGGMTMAVDLGLKGHEIRCCDLPAFDKNIKAIRERGGIEAKGEVKGFYKPAILTTDVKEAIDGADLIFITVRAFGHQDFIDRLVPSIRDGQIVVTWTSYFTALRIYELCKRKGVIPPVLADTHILPYFVKPLEPGVVNVFAKKQYMKLAAMPSSKTETVLNALKDTFPECRPGSNVLETTLDNQNIPGHVPIMLLNTGYWEKKAGDFLFFDFATQKVARMMEEIDKERLAVGRALGLKLTPIVGLQVKTYGDYGIREDMSVYELYSYKAKTTHSGYYPRMSLDDYVKTQAGGEDLLYGFVPISGLGKMVGVNTRVMNASVDIACVLFNRDFWAEGLTIEKLGLAGMSTSEILKYVDTGER